jgi:hypothetical protein
MSYAELEHSAVRGKIKARGNQPVEQTSVHELILPLQVRGDEQQQR